MQRVAAYIQGGACLHRWALVCAGGGLYVQGLPACADREVSASRVGGLLVYVGGCLFMQLIACICRGLLVCAGGCWFV
jgi:hypothetical protein